MKPITDPTQVEHLGRLLREMMLTEKERESELNPDWARNHGWRVVPVASMARIPVPDIPRIVSVLSGAGYTECIAVFNEPSYIQHLPVFVASAPPSVMATCHLLSINEADFRQFNRVFGAFRSVLTPEERSWAISCNEWYNLFAAEPELLEALLGKSIEQGRAEFFEFASHLAKGNSDEPILKAAKHYASL
jgi:hypothetical protein